MAARRGGGRTGTFLVLCGTMGILTVTFVAGVWTGQHWPVLFDEPKAPSAEPAGPRRAASTERPRPAAALPTLTFYDELKAPLTAPPPPPPRPARVPRTVDPARKDEAPATPSAAEPAPPAAAPAAAPSRTADARYTVQVAAYHVRSPAESLRATLAAAGHEARVVEAATPGGVRYRVQVGTFVTREAAQDAAARIRAERALPSFVTTR
jgi:DedD protein